MYETHWTGLSRPSWEREMDPQFSRQQVLLCCAGTPNQHRQTTACIVRCALGLHKGSFLVLTATRVLAPSYSCVPHADWLRHYSTTVLPNRVHFWYKPGDGLWWLGKIIARTTTDGEYFVRVLDDPGPIKLPLSPNHYTTPTGGIEGSRCLQLRRGRSIASEIQSNANGPRDADVAS